MSEVIKKKSPIGLRVRHVIQAPMRRRVALMNAHRRASARMVPVPLSPQVLQVNATSEQLAASVKFADEFNKSYKPDEGAPLFVEA